MKAGDYVFKEITVLKRDLYQTMLNILIEAGWENISSNPATDYDVFYSKGESGDKNLYFQIRSVYVTGSSDITTTTGGSISYRLVNKYIPSPSNTPGTFDRPADGWRYFNLFDQSLSLIIPVTITYHCNKNRLIVGLSTSPSSNINSNVFFLGMPDNTFVEEKESDGVIFAGGINYSLTAGHLLATNYSHKPGITSYLMTTNTDYTNQLSPNLTLNPIYYGDANEGVRGMLDGILLSNTNLTYKTGDLILDGNKIYKIFILIPVPSWTLFFPSKLVALRIK